MVHEALVLSDQDGDLPITSRKVAVAATGMVGKTVIEARPALCALALLLLAGGKLPAI